jgi:hypothetical protein
MFSEEEKNNYKISVLKLKNQLVYRPVFMHFPYKGKLLNQPSATAWEEEHLLKYAYCTF